MSLIRCKLAQFFSVIERGCLTGLVEIALFLGLHLGGARVYAETPVIEALFPAGVSPGRTNEISVFGKYEPWPPKVWIEGEGIQIVPSTNKGKYSVTVGSNALAGARLLRFYNDEGASDPLFLTIGVRDEITESEPNNHFEKPQLISRLPTVVNGRLERREDVDSFAIEMKPGEWLDARIESYTLMSKVDAVLRLVTTNGYQIEWNHDFATLDPRLIWRASTSQRVILQVYGFAYPANAEIQLYGGSGAFYRLHLQTSDEAPISCGPHTEREPNDSLQDAPEVQLPAQVRAAIGRPGDEDRYKISANKGDIIEAKIKAASLGSQLDAWLSIEDSSGNQLIRSDDAGPAADPELEWQAPTNGVFAFVAGSLLQRGNNEHFYELTIRHVQPDYQASVGAHSITATAGTTNELKVTLKRLRGFTNELSAGFRGLPNGVTSISTNLPAKDGTISLPLLVSENSPNYQGPIEVIINDRATAKERPVQFDLISRTENNGVPGGYTQLAIPTLNQVWLTVRSNGVPNKADAPK